MLPRGAIQQPRESGLTFEEFEQTQGEYDSTIHALLAALDAHNMEDVDWDTLVAQVIDWHPDVRNLRPGEFDEGELILQAVESY